MINYTTYYAILIIFTLLVEYNETLWLSVRFIDILSLKIFNEYKIFKIMREISQFYNILEDFCNHYDDEYNEDNKFILNEDKFRKFLKLEEFKRICK